jgi:hypothetical protein
MIRSTGIHSGNATRGGRLPSSVRQAAFAPAVAGVRPWEISAAGGSSLRFAFTAEQGRGNAGLKWTGTDASGLGLGRVDGQGGRMLDRGTENAGFRGGAP